MLTDDGLIVGMVLYGSVQVTVLWLSAQRADQGESYEHCLIYQRPAVLTNDIAFRSDKTPYAIVCFAILIRTVHVQLPSYYITRDKNF